MKSLVQSNTDIAALVLRLALGGVLLAHSAYLKFVVFSLAGTAQFFSGLGLPAFMAYLVFGAEVVAGILLVVGYKTRWASLAMVPILLGATWVHWSNGWLFSNAGGGWEYPLLLSCIAVVQFFLGGGRYAFEAIEAGQPQLAVNT